MGREDAVEGLRLLLLWCLSMKLDGGLNEELGAWVMVALVAEEESAMLFLNGECGVTMYLLHSSCIFVSSTKTPISAVAAYMAPKWKVLSIKIQP